MNEIFPKIDFKGFFFFFLRNNLSFILILQLITKFYFNVTTHNQTNK